MNGMPDMVAGAMQIVYPLVFTSKYFERLYIFLLYIFL